MQETGKKDAGDTNASEKVQDLRITELEFRQFRNYPHLHLGQISPLTVLVGPNAIGKTNIIEGIQLLTALTSFRHPQTAQMIQWGHDQSKISAVFQGPSRKLDLSLALATGQRRAYQCNGKTKSIQSLKGTLPAVIFTPDDLNLVKGAQAGKRDALDQLGSQLVSSYYVVKKDYETMLHHKNSLLKDEAPSALLDSVNDTLFTIGAQLFRYRSALFRRLMPEVSRFYQDLSGGGERLEAAYIPSWSEKQEAEETGGEPTEEFVEGTIEEVQAFLCDSAARRAIEEQRRKRALVGPHADHIEFYIDGKNARIFGSQGQQRSLVLSLKLAEVALIRNMLNQHPVLLLDDVMSELDANRRHVLIDFISEEIQTFVTTTNLDYFPKDLRARADVINVEKLEH